MISYTKAAMERAMKVQEVILRAMAKKITWWLGFHTHHASGSAARYAALLMAEGQPGGRRVNPQSGR